MDKPKRILHILASLDSGGVANFVMNIYRRIDRDRYQFDFALTSGKPSLMDDEAKSLGARLFYFDPSMSLTNNLEHILKTESDIYGVHSHVFFYSGLMLKTAKKCGVELRVAHAHNAHTGEKRSLPRLAYEASMRHMIRRNATVLLGCSEKACRYVFGESIMSDARASVLPDGIDCDRFAFDAAVREKMRKKYGLEDKFVVGHVGHFNPAKNHEKILGTFAELCKERPNSALLLTGDGELEDNVRSLAESLGISDKTVFTGAMSDVENAYMAMDVFLFPSRYEGFGMAMIEAQASGLVCVASDVVPKDTNADGRTTYLPLSESDETWAKTVLSAPERDISSAEKVKERFDVNSVAKTLEKIYA